jgi:hypothetical protein
MTAARHNPTRRALLGAAVFAPVLVAGSGGAAGAASVGRRRWDRALAALRDAEAAVAACRARDYLPAHEIHAAIRGRWPIPYDFAADPEARAAVSASLAEFQPFEDRLNALGDARDAAQKRLLRTPAPDLPALALKIELIVDEEVATLAGGERCLAALKADGWRLAGSQLDIALRNICRRTNPHTRASYPSELSIASPDYLSR